MTNPRVWRRAMRRIFISVPIALLSFAASFAASAQEPPITLTFTCQINGLDAEKRCLSELKRQLSAAKATRPKTVASKAPIKAAGLATKAPVKDESLQTPSATSTIPSDGETKLSHLEKTILIRKSMDDLGSFGRPSKLKNASGAEFSWARDQIAGNDTWNAQGLVALRLVYWENEGYSPYIAHALAAPYVSFDRVTNTTAKSNDVNDLTFGFANEVALANFMQATHYFRLRAEEDSDFEGRAKNWAVIAEYQPFGNLQLEGGNSVFAYLGTPLPLGPNWFLTLSPKLRAEYRSSLNGSTDPIFTTNNQVLRVGPSVTMSLNGNTVFEDVPWYIQRTHFRVTYGMLYDTLAQRNYNLLDTTLTYDLDEEGYIGLSLSYRLGQLETTGQNINLAKIALSAKYGQ